MNNFKYQTVKGWKDWFNYDFKYHLTSRIPHEHNRCSEEEKNRWLCRNVLKQIEKINNIKISAISVKSEKENCYHSLIEILYVRPEHNITDIILPVIENDKNALVLKEMFAKTKEYVFEHLLDGGYFHQYNKRLIIL